LVLINNEPTIIIIRLLRPRLLQEVIEETEVKKDEPLISEEEKAIGCKLVNNFKDCFVEGYPHFLVDASAKITKSDKGLIVSGKGEDTGFITFNDGSKISVTADTSVTLVKIEPEDEGVIGKIKTFFKNLWDGITGKKQEKRTIANLAVRG